MAELPGLGTLHTITTLLTLLLPVVLVIVFVAAVRRIAIAQEESAKAQAEMAKQLATLNVELRHQFSGRVGNSHPHPAHDIKQS